jgi:hypothetical protein
MIPEYDCNIVVRCLIYVRWNNLILVMDQIPSSRARNIGHVRNNALPKKSDRRKDLPVTRNRNANRTITKQKILPIAHEESRSL